LGLLLTGGLERRRLREVEGGPDGSLAHPVVHDQDRRAPEAPSLANVGARDPHVARAVVGDERDSVRLEREDALALAPEGRAKLDGPDGARSRHGLIFVAAGRFDHNERMGFVDEVTVFVRGGRGGDGSSSMLREPFKPRGGPDGGDGGRGGNVVFEVSSEVRDLSALAEHPHLRARAGGSGGGRGRSGRSGEDLVTRVPNGTVVVDGSGLLADLVGERSRAVVARGGRGGRGNASVASRRGGVPPPAEAGEPGEEKQLNVELRIVADIGLVGLPNAGKSTLLGRLTAARPKVAAYPFTTLTPNLGVTSAVGERFVVADVPGLVEGAHRGKGLGDRFLRHVTRCRGLVFVVDLSAPDPVADLETVRKELAAFDPVVASRPCLVVGTKGDLVPDAADAARRLSPDALAVSGLAGHGIEELAERMAALARVMPEREEERRPFVMLRPARPPFVVKREGQRFRVVGRGVERWVSETDFDDPRKVVQLQKRLAKEGVEKELAAMGARRGDEVLIGERAFEFLPDGGD
jgi:GTP-binding protein